MWGGEGKSLEVERRVGRGGSEEQTTTLLQFRCGKVEQGYSQGSIVSTRWGKGGASGCACLVLIKLPYPLFFFFFFFARGSEGHTTTPNFSPILSPSGPESFPQF